MKNQNLLRAGGALALLFVALTTPNGYATDFFVTNTNDDGAGSLRQAIVGANADASAPHAIYVDNAVTGTITLLSDLPAFARTTDVVITGANSLTITGGAASIDSGITTTLSIGPGTPTSVESAISGSGGVEKQGVGTIILSGTNNYSGGTTVTGGTLQGTTTSLQGDITNNATVIFNQAGDGTYDGNMTGTGELTKQGAGTVTLDGTNDYSGGTTVSAGTLQGTTASLQGDITNNAAVIFNQAGDGTYDGNMTGTGELTKQGAGTVTLDGTNDYSGGTTVSAGTLQGTTSSLQGDITNDAAVIFNQAGDGTYDGNMTGTGELTKQGAGTVTLDGTNDYSGGTTVSAGTLQGTTSSLQGGITNDATVIFNQAGDGTYDGNMTGTGELTKQGAGTVTLDGTNDYSGGTTVSAGTLQGTTASLQGDITNNAAVIFNQAGDGTYDGNMTGTGELTKQGAGTVTLDGTNDYSGGTTVSAGTLQGTTSSLQGDITNDAAVIFNQAGDGTYDGNMTGTGELTKQGAGTVTLDGTNDYSGGTTVSAGTLQGTTSSLQGGITNDATVIFNQAGDGTYDGNMTGTGELTKQGAGTVTLDGTNDYSGGTTVSAGTLQGTTSSLQGDITNDAAVIFNQAGDGTYDGNMTGTGELTKQGAGTVTLDGTNDYSGGTTVSAGTLQGTTASLQGDMTNNATVVFDQSTDGSYDGDMSGTGGLTKQGSGTVTLNGTNTYSGDTTVAAGDLVINGSITSDLSVDAGTQLRGSGTVGSTTVSGSIAPGNSIGTFTVNGTYTQNVGSTYEVELNDLGTVPGDNNDLIDVTGAPGTAIIHGGTVDVQAAAGTYQPGTTYTILRTTGGTSGAGFTSVTDYLALRDFVLVYGANNIDLMVQRAPAAYAATALTQNQWAVGTELDLLGPLAVGDMGDLLDELMVQSASQQQAAMSQMSGELYGSLASVGLQHTSQLNQLLGRRLRNANSSGRFLAPRNVTQTRPPAESAIQLVSYSDVDFSEVGCDQSPARCRGPRWDAWLLGYGLGGDAEGDGNAAGLDYSLGGSLLGLQRWVNENTLLGMYGGFGHAHLETVAPRQTARVDATQLGAYFRHIDGWGYWQGTGGFGYDDYESSRNVAFGGINRVARGDYSGQQAIVTLERGTQRQWGQIGITPFTTLQYIYHHQNDFTETGAGAMNLSVDDVDTHSLRSMLGVDITRSFAKVQQLQFAHRAHALWMHEFLDTEGVVQSRFSTNNASSFAVQGLNLGRDWAMAGYGVTLQPRPNVNLHLGYDVQFNEHQAFHVGNGGVQLTW